jgi:hypothetical protein
MLSHLLMKYIINQVLSIENKKKYNKMIIDRVILAVDNNKIYTPFWNIVSPVWKKIFNINPTLIFNGTVEEFQENEFDMRYGDYIIINKVEECSESNPDWSVTWSLFWAASKFKDDVCILSGIDQIPIGYLFFEKLLNIKDDKFVVGFSDAYKEYNKDTLGYFNTNTNVLYPSSHLVGKGSKFKEIYNIDDEWVDEIKKVYNSKDKYYLNNNFYESKLWGLDECYSSDKIALFDKKDDIIHFDIFWKYWYKNRIDFGSNINLNYDIDLVRSGYYSELTCKEYNYRKNEIEYIISNLEKIKYTDNPKK